jgi:hypothetical protein
MNEHPDFEELSAFVDGEAPQWRDHVGSCPACQVDVDRLRAVVAAVGQPVPPMGAVARERALSLALDALDTLGPAAAATDSGSGAALGGAEAPSVRPLRPLPPLRSPAAQGQPPVVVVPPAPRWGRKGPWVALGSVAAVLLAFVLGAAVLRGPGGDGRDGGGGDTQTLASGSPDAAERATAPPGGYGLDQSATAGAGGVTGADLGSVDDAAQLEAKAGAGLGRRSDVASPEPAPTAAGALPRSPEQDSGLAGTTVGTRPCEEQV